MVSKDRKCIDDGVAAAGMIVQQTTVCSPLEHDKMIAYVMVSISLLSVLLLYRVSVMAEKKLGEKKV